VLIQRFLYDRDQSAFECIVKRYSRLVLGVAGRHLRDRNRAEDVFQATFLVLAKNARRIRKRRSLASWLHGVSRRIALRTMSEVKREARLEPLMEPASNMLAYVVDSFEQQALDKELAQLPEKYRDPITLHYLEGLSFEEIGKRLGLSTAAVDGRLKRGRKDLRLRLARRGITLSVAASVFQLSQQAAQAATFPTLVTSTTVAAQALAAGTAVSSCTPNAVLLAGKELAVMAAAKTTMILSITGAVCLAAGMVIAQGTGTGEGAGSTGTGTSAVSDAGAGGSGTIEVDLAGGDEGGTSLSDTTSAGTTSANEGEAGVHDHATGSETADASGGSAATTAAIPDDAETYDLRVYPLQNTQADVMVTVFEQIMPELRGRITADPRSNSVMVAASVEEQQHLAQLIQALQAFANTEGSSISSTGEDVVGSGDAAYPGGGFPSAGEAGGAGAAAADSEELRIYLLENTQAAGAVETISALLPGVRVSADERTNSVLVAASAEQQGEIEAILRNLDEAPAVGSSHAGGMPGIGSMSSMMGGGGAMGGGPDSVDYGARSPNRERIESALTQITQAEFHSMPLVDGIAYISEVHEVPIRLDLTALQNAGITADEEISYDLGELPLQDALDIMLSDVAGTRLAYIIKNDVMMITTGDEADEFMESRLYEMRYYQGLNPTLARQLIQEGTSGEWKDVTGVGGSIVPIQGGLMIRQNQRVHREIHALLEQLQRFSAVGLEIPPDWQNVDGSGYVPGIYGGASYGSGMMMPGMSSGIEGMGGEGSSYGGPTGGGAASGGSPLGPPDTGGGSTGGFGSGAIFGGDPTGTQFDAGDGSDAAGGESAFGGYGAGATGSFDAGETSIPGGPESIGQ
jgi:RNA polymerase sigma factor (sigma-70 family)